MGHNWKPESKEKARARHTARRAYRRQRFASMKQETGCVECGESDPRCLDFHHIDKSTKSFAIGSNKGGDGNWDEVLAEIAKCVVLCANCHRKGHKESGAWQ